MKEYKDMLGNIININDRIVYGKSNRHDPIKLGIVEYFDNGVVVLGDGHTKTGLIKDSERRIVVIKPYVEVSEDEYLG